MGGTVTQTTAGDPAPVQVGPWKTTGLGETMSTKSSPDAPPPAMPNPGHKTPHGYPAAGAPESARNTAEPGGCVASGLSIASCNVSPIAGMPAWMVMLPTGLTPQP